MRHPNLIYKTGVVLLYSLVDYPDVPAFVRGVVHEEILGAKVHAFVMPKGAGTLSFSLLLYFL